MLLEQGQVVEWAQWLGFVLVVGPKFPGLLGWVAVFRVLALRSLVVLVEPVPDFRMQQMGA